MEKWLPHTSWSGRRRTDFQRGALPMQVTINTENRSGRIRNFWNHIPFHPTDAGELQLHSPEEMIFPDGFFHTGSCHDAQCGLPAGIPSGTGRLPKRGDWERMFFPCVRRISCGQRPESSIMTRKIDGMRGRLLRISRVRNMCHRARGSSILRVLYCR